jgi:pyruvate dehydrogenase E2 component (dihydrolipoamide acetyltransferase)
LPSGRIKASPRAKKKAEELGVDLSLIIGTGPGGRIVEKDIVAQPAAMMMEDSRKVRGSKTLTPLRRTIARRMTQSWQHPHITMITEIDMSEIVTLREEINKKIQKKLGFRVSFNDIIVKAVADTLEKFPKFNATLAGNEFRMFSDINIGVAMATEEGLIVPTVKAANKKSITQIAQEIRVLGKKVKENALDPEDLAEGTFTVSNLGSFGVDLFIPVINPPESAILALGQIKKKPVVIDDIITVRSMMMASCGTVRLQVSSLPPSRMCLRIPSS